MPLVQIQKDTAAIAAEIANIEAKLPTMNAIHGELVTLGVTTPTLSDLRALHALGNGITEAHLKPLVARGKSLTIAGVAIDISFISLNAELVASIKSKLSSLTPYVMWGYYEIVAAAVVVVDDLEAQIEPGYVTMGTDLALEVIEDVEPIASAINAVLEKMNLNSNFQPMRDLDNWLVWDVVSHRYSVDRISIGRHVTGELPESEG